MKKTYILLFLSLLFTLQGCLYFVEEEPIINDSNFEPIFMTREELNASIEVTDPRPLQHPGKIYRFGNLMFINEVGQGVHIFNNINPRNPQNLRFIKVPGNLDIAVKDNFLFVDNVVDLVVLDISVIQNIKVVKRNENVFPQNLCAPDGWYCEPENPDLILTGWKEKN
ncbi:MAG: hypothetical protein AAFX87_21980 [Bacteroidota bacterium]